ncbi:MAG: helix-turn-helix domain-containing protein [Candidatus Micrarchaeia archaeon]
MYEEFAKIGLTRREAEVYMLLLEFGPLTAQEVAKNAKINRSFAYSVLSSLMEKGLVSHVISGGRQIFSPASPEKLLDVLAEEEERLRETKSRIATLVNTLLAMKKGVLSEIRVEVYRGVGGYKTIMEDILREGKDYYVIGYGAKGKEIAKIYERNWHKRRIKKRITRWLLALNELKGKKDVRYRYTKVKFLPPEYVGSAYFIVYGHKSVIFLPRRKDFVGILIEDAEIARAYKNSFNHLWKTL